ncbi:amino acid ABC transporter substrate-binding protein [Asticcacaulis machinosus]|uniref:Amino acid ABC transporter substrate-binding protein n=1 Tax=Asticcacaulis machinosus TaxID=2984211 RepID=A0ABT5HP89_9CAUL|nr:amino acid ABC transporter substrate-binding protein [Asticcacaulis machinosus]MDC7677454.1 amino acid ABC transporter substrate-binding protein [Asticcacaulis machinosus]
MPQIARRRDPMRRRGLAIIGVVGALAACSPAPKPVNDAAPAGKAGSTLATVQKHGYVSCGASQANAGFSLPDDKGYWRGLDIDMCRAVAAAVLGDQDKARFVPLTGQQRLTALQTGEIDLLPRTTTWTMARDANGVNFTFPNYYDYTGFMVRAATGATKPADIKGASVCVQTGSITEVIFADVSWRQKLDLKPVIFDNVSATRQAFFSGRCDALITDASSLYSVRATQSKNPDDYVIFAANDEANPLTPAVRHGDDQWFDIVKWVFQAQITAEYLGITRDNVDEMLKSEDPAIRRLLGVEPGYGKALGLREDWAYQIIKQVGNYGEVYDRNVGKDSKLKIDRGLNRLQRDGGLMVPLPFS